MAQSEIGCRSVPWYTLDVSHVVEYKYFFPKSRLAGIKSYIDMLEVQIDRNGDSKMVQKCEQVAKGGKVFNRWQKVLNPGKVTCQC